VGSNGVGCRSCLFTISPWPTHPSRYLLINS
jgi:hypothetical protein